MTTTLYNEIDQNAAQWLRNLINEQHITNGDVYADTIETCDPSGYVRFHTFAGIGIWDYALQLVDWPEDLPVWTGSCPCQPFSLAGKGKGTEDVRHLWPVWRDLIATHRPPVVFGEQVASPAGRAWLDAVQADMEALGYAFVAADVCAAGVGAPHIRQRIFFGAVDTRTMADSVREGLERYAGHVGAGGEPGREHPYAVGPAAPGGGLGGLEQPDGERCQVFGLQLPQRRPGSDVPQAERAGQDVRVGDTCSTGSRGHAGAVHRAQAESPFEGCTAWRITDERFAAGAVRGAWAGADWLLCRDPSDVPRWRPVEPGTLPLAHGAAGRVGRVRAYGNGIVGQVAAWFIASFIEAITEEV